MVLIVSPLLSGEEPEQPGDKQRAEHLARMQDLAASIRVLADPRRTDSAVVTVHPTLRYGCRLAVLV